MKKLLRLFSFLSLLLFLSTLGTMASAQVGPPATSWTTVPMAFYGQIHIVKFLDAQNLPLIGFVGDDTGIWRTTNGGTTWTRAGITDPPQNNPAPFPSGYVNDITFEADGVHGFAILDSNSSQNDAGILITTDGGKDWTFDDVVGTPDSGRGIYYNTANNRLYVASCDRGLVVSTDNGGTWNVLDSNLYYTGFAFNSNGYGVVATQGTICNTRTQNAWLYTTDGGFTWAPTRMFNQSWQPLGIPTTQTFFGSTEHSCTGINNQIERSDDGGYGYKPIAGYAPSNSDTLTEAMQGDGCEQFASSFSQDGMWYSTNDGATWAVIPSSPTPGVDTRFYASPDTLWSFTGDSLKWFPRPATGDIHIWPDTIAFTNAACMFTSDTTIHIFGCNCSDNPQLTGTTIVRGTDLQDTIQAVINPSTPPSHALCSGGVGTADSVTLYFQPTTDSPDNANIVVQFSDNGKAVDTVVHMTANGIKPGIQFPTKTISLSGPACSGTIDTCVEITNEGCSTITLTQNSLLSESPECKAQLQMTGYCELTNGSNPQGISLLPGESFCFEIDFVPGLIVGSCDACVQLDYKTADGSVDSLTNCITVVGNTTTGAKPSFRGFNINEASCCSVPSDTTIYFINTTCDTIELRAPIITGHTACAKNFRIDSSGSAPGTFPIHFPVKIAPNSHVPITIDLDCEGISCTAYITFPYTIFANFASAACALIFDSSLFASDSLIDTVSLTTKSEATPPTMPVSVNFGNVNCCDSLAMQTVTVTAGCRPDTVTGISLTTSGGNFYVDSANFSSPVYLAAGQKVAFQLGFLPRCAGGGGTNDADTVTVTYLNGSGQEKLTSQVHATSTNLATANTSPGPINFDSVEYCAGQMCVTDTFTNASCGAIKINVNTPPQNACITLSGVTSTTIPVGGKMVITACLNPAACGVTGNISNFVIFQVTDPNGANFTFDTVTLSGYIIAPVASNTVTSLTPATMCDTATLDETFTVTSNSTCYTYDIISASPNGPQVTVTTTLPVHIDSGQSQTFTVQFKPGVGSGNLTGSIVLTDSAGNTITVPYDITVTPCGNSKTCHLVLTDSGNIIITPNCTTGVLTFVVSESGSGCTGEFNGISLTGSPQFTPGTPTSSPNLPFTGTVLFDPNQTGSDSALVTLSVNINGTDTNVSFEVYGKVVGVKDSARIGVVGLTQGCIFPNDTMLDTFAVVLHDTIPDALGVTQLSFVISYNGNLLWDDSILGTLAPGWTVSSMTEETDGLHITLTYSGNPSGTTPANDTLLKITQKGAISDSVISTARLTDAHFNDSAFEACTLKALSAAGDSAGICIDTTGCGGRLIHGLFNNTLQPFTGIEVVPNPAHKGSSAATLHFTTNLSGNVLAEVLDELGHTVLTLNNGPLETGDHALAIPTDNIPEGSYFTRISVGGYTVIRKFVLVKE